MDNKKKIRSLIKIIRTKSHNIKHNTLEISNGNYKLSKSTLIINMGTALDCPSAKLGMCNALKCGATCYALKAERLYPNVPEFRYRQFSYWRNNNATKIYKDIVAKISIRNGKPIKYLRFNEAGDFWDQNDVKKLSIIAHKLKNFNIITYGYTARSDLDFSNIEFLVKGSGHTNGNNGSTTIINKDDVIPEGYIECPGSCKTCDECMTNIKSNIAFRKH